MINRALAQSICPGSQRFYLETRDAVLVWDGAISVYRQEVKRRENIFLGTMVTGAYCTFEVFYDPLGQVFTALNVGVPNSFCPDIAHHQDVVRKWGPHRA